MNAEALRTQLGRLLHDVGKHGARAARNLPPEGAIPEALTRMLIADLFERSDGTRVSNLFATLASPIEADGGWPELARCRAIVEAIDALEPRVRARQEPSIREAAALALLLEARLRAILASRTETP
ncbi:MAG: hypothetical protein OEY14_10440 [Myxococcales bacterium]|nr:hypothetical protein [Myxococcales bacterium]